MSRRPKSRSRDTGAKSIAEGRFEGEISAPAFTAEISLTSNGHSQAVSIKPSGGDVSDVGIELKRNG
jgi:hypothetical protein